MTLATLNLNIVAQETAIFSLKMSIEHNRMFGDELASALHAAEIALADMRNLRLELAARQAPSPAAGDTPPEIIVEGVKTVQ